jgi:acyl-CoA oxidase
MTDTRIALDALRIQAVLDGRWGHVRRETREFLRQELLHPVAHLETEAHRARVLAQARALADGPGTRLGFPSEYGGGDDIGAYIAAFTTLGMGDLSLLVKAGVQWGLFGGAIHHLGTRRHHDAYLRDVMSLDLPGCFAMT